MSNNGCKPVPFSNKSIGEKKMTGLHCVVQWEYKFCFPLHLLYHVFYNLPSMATMKEDILRFSFSNMSSSVSSNFSPYFNSFTKVMIIFQSKYNDTYLQSAWQFWHPCLLTGDHLQAIQDGMICHDHVKPLLSTELSVVESVYKIKINTINVYPQFM